LIYAEKGLQEQLGIQMDLQFQQGILMDDSESFAPQSMLLTYTHEVVLAYPLVLASYHLQPLAQLDGVTKTSFRHQQDH
jgi:hypothetical protein